MRAVGMQTPRRIGREEAQEAQEAGSGEEGKSVSRRGAEIAERRGRRDSTERSCWPRDSPSNRVECAAKAHITTPRAMNGRYLLT